MGIEKVDSTGGEKTEENKSENEVSKKEVITLDIEGKSYEVIKTHFTYPEYIQKENGGVEGYDRFELSWDDFDKEKLDSIDTEIKDYEKQGEHDKYKYSLYEDRSKLKTEITSKLDKISQKLGIGTEMKDESISHYVNGAYGSRLEWSDNRFFLNKPFDIKDAFDYMKTKKTQPSNSLAWLVVDKNNSEFNLSESLEKSGIISSEIASHNGVEWFNNNTIGFYRTTRVERLLEYKEDAIEILEDVIKDKDLILVGAGVGGMSFAQGSNLISYEDSLSKESYYNRPFLNFNKRNTAFSDYLSNIERYRLNLTDKLKDKIRIPTRDSFVGHPSMSMVFTKEFPAFNWAMADTAYVPMKDGPNFFRFYSKEK
jgi:hypothetical protein